MYKIVAVSSQSSVHPVENIKNLDLFRPWQTEDENEKAIIEIEFYKGTMLTNLEIGNAGSAFVEVLAGMEKQEPEDYSCIVPITTFMTPDESSKGIQKNRTKIFDSKLVQFKNVKFEKVRIVCTQPFSHQPFGLSFVNINKSIGSSNEQGEEKNEVKIEKQGIEKFLKREGSFTKKSGYLFFEKDKQEKSQVSDPKIKGISLLPPSIASAVKSLDEPKKLLNQIMENVVFVLSGFQGKPREELRTMMQDMGGQYDQEWSNKATHLICDFSSSPKISKVKELGSGTIVNSQWVKDCFNQKKRLPIKSYLIWTSKIEDDTKLKVNKGKIQRINKLQTQTIMNLIMTVQNKKLKATQLPL